MNRFTQFLLTIFLLRALTPIAIAVIAAIFFLAFYLLLGVINFTTQAGW